MRSLLVIPTNDDTENATENAVASPTFAASASDDGKIMLWDLLTTQIVHQSDAECAGAINAGTGVASPFSIPVGVTHLIVGQIKNPEGADDQLNKSEDVEDAASLRIFLGRGDGSVAMLDAHSGDALCTQQVT